MGSIPENGSSNRIKFGTKEGAWDQIAKEISDDVLHLFAVIGKHDVLAQLIGERFSGCLDMVYASTSSDIRPKLTSDVLSEIQRIATPFNRFLTGWTR